MIVHLMVWLLVSTLNVQQDDPVHPVEVISCIERDSFKDQIEVSLHNNPYYLRGDFDGDKRIDLAIQIKGRKTRRNGVLICTAKESIVLGANSPTVPPFSTMPGDNFVAPHWEVFTREETRKISTYNPVAPKEAKKPKGESIAMIWEDGISIIFWDGKRFRWTCYDNCE